MIDVFKVAHETHSSLEKLKKINFMQASIMVGFVKLYLLLNMNLMYLIVERVML